MFKNISIKKSRLIYAISTFLSKINTKNFNDNSDNEDLIQKDNYSNIPTSEKYYLIEYKYHINGKWYKQNTILSTIDELIIKNENKIIQLIKEWDFCFRKNKPVLIEIIEIKGPGKLIDIST